MPWWAWTLAFAAAFGVGAIVGACAMAIWSAPRF